MASHQPAFLLQAVITDDNKWCDIDIGFGEVSISIATGTYDDVIAIAAALEAALQVEDPTFAVTVGATGTVTISMGGSFDLLWSTGTHGSGGTDQHIGTLLGFDDSADDASASSYDSDNQHQRGFYVQNEGHISFDSYDMPVKIGPASFIALDGTLERCTYGDHTKRRIDLATIPRALYFEAFATDPNAPFTVWWEIASGGTPFELYTDTDPFTSAGTWALIQGENEGLLESTNRLDEGAAYFSTSLMLQYQG
jgi:hypothetical protein